MGSYRAQKRQNLSFKEDCVYGQLTTPRKAIDMTDLKKTITSHLLETSSTYTLPSSDNEQLLYQFTDAAGLIGIAQAHCIHATHFGFLNDQSEGKYGFNVLQKAAVGLKPNTNNDFEQELLSRIIDFSSTLHTTQEYYISCFSEKDDHHGQWIQYGDRGRGFSIGFRAADLNEYLVDRNSESEIRLLKVVYKKDKQIELFTRQILGVLNIGTNVISQGLSEMHALEISTPLLLNELAFLCLAFKDYRYSDEAEWRICLKSHSGAEDKVNFRNGNFGLTPFKQLFIDSTKNSCGHIIPIKKVRIGFASDPETTKRALNLLFRSTGHMSSGIEFERTSLPGRY